MVSIRCFPTHKKFSVFPSFTAAAQKETPNARANSYVDVDTILPARSGIGRVLELPIVMAMSKETTHDFNKKVKILG